VVQKDAPQEDRPQDQEDRPQDDDTSGQRSPDVALSRRRLLLGAGGAVVVVGGLAAGGAVLLSHNGRDDREPATGGGSAGGIEPVRHLHLAWLPAGWRQWESGVDANQESVIGGDPNDSGVTVRAIAYVAGLQPPADYRDKLSDTWAQAAGPERVNDHATRWMGAGSARRSAQIRMQWQPTPGSWVEVDYVGHGGQDNLGAAHQIASGLQFDKNERIKVPARVRSLPATLVLQAVEAFVPGSDDQWMFTLAFAPGKRPLDATVVYPSLDIVVQPMNDTAIAGKQDQSLGADATVDGHPARYIVNGQNGSDYEEQLRTWDVNGLAATVTVRGEQTRTAIGADAALTVFRHLELFPAPADWV
jgi:hypothetical protein